MNLKHEQSLVDTVVTFDTDHTYEICKTYGDNKKEKLIVIGMYPTISGNLVNRFDSTLLHLNNHLDDMNISEIRVLNLFSTVFPQKPRTAQLVCDKANLDYIQSVLTSKDINNYKIVLAYGSAHASNRNVMVMKLAVLEMIQKAVSDKQVFHIVTEYLCTENPIATHVLYLGLRHGDEVWKLQQLDIDHEIKEYRDKLQENDKKATVAKKKAGAKNTQESNKEADKKSITE